MPFENVTRDSRIFWLSEAAAVLLADDLNALRRQRDHARRAARRVRALAGAAGRRPHRCDRHPDRPARRRLAGDGRLLQLERGDTGRPRQEHRSRDRAHQTAVATRGPLPELFATFEHMARVLPPDVPPAGPAPASSGRGLRKLRQGAARRDADDRRSTTQRRWRHPAVRSCRGWPCGRLCRSGRARRRRLEGGSGVARFGRGAPCLAGLSQLSLERFDERSNASSAC